MTRAHLADLAEVDERAEEHARDQHHEATVARDLGPISHPLSCTCRPCALDAYDPRDWR